nr:hypothetical protein GCM10020063_009640 [Dactylosporangium thailandense]
MRTLGRALRAAAAAVALLLGLAVLPALLIVVQSTVAWDWRALLGDPQSPATLLALGLGAGWLLWLALLIAVITDAVAAVRGLRRVTWLPVSLHAAVTAAASGVLLAVYAVRGGTATTPATAGTVPATATTAPDAATGPPTAPLPPPPGWAAATAVAQGLELPGGWLPLPVATAVGAAVALAWAQRRRDYVPGPPTGWRRNDPDLVAPAASVRHLLRAAHAADDGLPDIGTAELGDPAQPDAAGPAADPGADGGSPAAATDPDRAPALLDLLPAGELRLTGPGGHDAARGILVALSALPNGRPRIVRTAGFAAAVLGVPHAPTCSGPPPGHTTGQHKQPTTDVVVFAAGPEPGAAAPVDDRPAPADPDPSTVHAVRCTIRVAATPGSGVCWHIARDGTVHALTGPAPTAGRLPILDRRTTRDILTSLGALPPPAADTSQPAPSHHQVDHDIAAANSIEGWPDPPPGTAGQVRRLLIRVLGEVTVLRPHPDGSHSPVSIRRSAGQQILVLLALHRDGLTDSELRQALWPDVPSSAAQRRYATTMSELRRTLHTAAGRPVLVQDPADPVRRRHPHRLDPAAVQVDIWRLQGLLDTAATTDDPTYRRLLLAAAAGVSGGELAAGWTYAWLLEDRERLVRHLLDVATHLADSEPDHHAALRLLHQALQLAPTNEHLHQRVLQRHAAAGDHDGLRRAAATLTEHLTAHSLQPEPATVTLLTTLFTGSPQPTARPPGTGRVMPATPEGNPP